jgi:hypothetical protein
VETESSGYASHGDPAVAAPHCRKIDAMNDIDDEIRRTLSGADALLWTRFEPEPSLRRQVLAMFRGRMRWVNAAGWFAGFALLAAGAYFWWRFAFAEDARHMLLWAAPALLCFLGLGLIKVWFWLELQKNALLLEIKRLELLVAGLAARPGRGDNAR